MIQLDPFISRIKDNSDEIICPLHSEDIGLICIESGSRENLYKLLCTKCEQNHDKSHVKITYPRQFLDMVKAELDKKKDEKEEASQNIKEDKTELQKNFWLFLQRAESLLNEIDEMLHHQRKQVKIIQEKLFQAGLLQKVPIYQLVTDRLQRMSEALNYEDLQKSIYEFKILQQNQYQSFPLVQPDIQIIRSAKLNQITLIEFEKGVAESLKSFEKLKKEIAFLYKAQDDVKGQAILVKDVDDQVNQGKQICSDSQIMVKLSDNVKNLPLNFKVLLQREILQNYKFYYSCFYLNYQTVAIFALNQRLNYNMVILNIIGNRLVQQTSLDLGKNWFGQGIGRNLVKLDQNMFICGIYDTLIIYQYVQSYTYASITFDWGSGFDCMTLDDNKNLWVSLFKGQFSFQIVRLDQPNYETPNLFLSGHKSNIDEIVNFDRDYIITGSRDKSIKIWHKVTGNCVKTISLDFIVFAIAVVKKDIYKIYVGGHSNVIQILEFQQIQQSYKESYLQFPTIKNQIFCITSFSKGFLINSSDLGSRYLDLERNEISQICQTYISQGSSMVPGLLEYAGKYNLIFSDLSYKNLIIMVTMNNKIDDINENFQFINSKIFIQSQMYEICNLCYQQNDQKVNYFSKKSQYLLIYKYSLMAYQDLQNHSNSYK